MHVVNLEKMEISVYQLICILKLTNDQAVGSDCEWLGIPSEDLDEVAGEREVWTSAQATTHAVQCWISLWCVLILMSNGYRHKQ